MGLLLTESIVGKRKGADITIAGCAVTTLFSESQSRYLVTVKEENREQFEAIIEAQRIGRVTADKKLVVKNANDELVVQLDVDELENAWKNAIPREMEK